MERLRTEQIASDIAKRQEAERRQRIRDYDSAADELLSRIIRAKVELDAIITSSDLVIGLAGLGKMREWVQTHSTLIAFGPFSAVADELNETQGRDLTKEVIEEALDDDSFIEQAVDFADSEFGIERLWQMVDGIDKYGQLEGGREMEMANGRYEYDYVRYNRLLLSVPDADRGWVYILVNSAMPGMVKIGFTKKNPQHRAANLSTDTGVPTPFTVAFSELVGNCRRVEAGTHERLVGFRVSHNREFFRISVEDAVSMVRLVAREFSQGS